MTDVPPQPAVVKTEESPAEPQQTSLPVADPVPEENAAPLSKKAQKRALKEAKWLAGKEERDIARRQKRKEVKAMRKQKVQDGTLPQRPRFAVDQKMSDVGVIIDLDFETKMKDTETKSTAVQIARCYSANKHSQTPVHLHLTSFKGLIKQTLASSDPNYERWLTSKCPAHFHEEDLDSAFPSRSNIVYLTADSPNVIETLDDTKLYVIGGLVDKNRYPNLCFNKAKELGLAHGKLPIGEHLQMATRKVLAINHVFEIMLKYLETKDWKESFLAIIPARKGGQLKSSDGDAEVKAEADADEHGLEAADTPIKEEESDFDDSASTP